MSCRVFFDGNEFYSGGEVRGRVQVTFHRSEKIRGIKIRAFGDEHTEWTDTRDEYDQVLKRNVTITYPCTGNNSLFNFEIMLYGGSGETHLGPGNFNYPFSFHLPPNLPSSFVNQYGYIRYGVKGIVDVPWAADYEEIKNFEVASPIDLNTFPMECFQPVSRSDSKTVCCWCCAQGDISLDININKTAFVPGENLKLYMTLTNMSNSNVEEVVAKFVQYLKSKVEEPNHDSKQDRYEFSTNNWSGVGAHGENKYDMEIPIPPQAPFPNLNRSSLFEISHEVEISAVLSGLHTDMELSFTVEIGHIQHQSQLNNPPPAGIYPSTPPGYPMPSQPVPPNEGGAYPHIPQASAPLYPAGSNSGATYPPDYKTVYPGGPPESSTTMNPKEREALIGGHQAPSAPSSTGELPPSYEDASRNENK